MKMSQLELDSAKFFVLQLLHTNTPELMFDILDNRNAPEFKMLLPEKLHNEVNENSLYVRSAFFQPDNEEFAGISLIDADLHKTNVSAFAELIWDLRAGILIDYERKLRKQ